MPQGIVCVRLFIEVIMRIKVIPPFLICILDAAPVSSTTADARYMTIEGTVNKTAFFSP